MATNHKSKNSKEVVKKKNAPLLDEMALAELLAETKRAKDRTQSMGTLGWTKPQTNVERGLVSTRRDSSGSRTPPPSRKVASMIRRPKLANVITTIFIKSKVTMRVAAH
jgi:hypothetical protein